MMIEFVLNCRVKDDERRGIGAFGAECMPCAERCCRILRIDIRLLQAWNALVAVAFNSIKPIDAFSVMVIRFVSPARLVIMQRYLCIRHSKLITKQMILCNRK